MKYIIYGFQIIKLAFCKVILRKKIKLDDSILKYNISLKTQIKCGDNGTIRIGRIVTETNVHLVSWGGTLTIGKGCSFNRNTIVVSRKQITIDDGTLVGPNVCIYDHDHAFGSEGIIKNQLNYGSVEIGKNVWIGAGTIILRGTTIGDNCVIGAGCIISGTIPAYSLVTSENRNLKIERLHRKQDETGIME